MIKNSKQGIGYALFVLSFCLNIQLSAQQDTIQTIFKKQQEPSVHFFFEPEVKAFFQNIRFDESMKLILGSKSALIFNNRFVVGLAGYCKVTPSTYYNEYRYKDDDTGAEVVVPSQKMRTGYGYAGLVLGGIFQPYKAVHLGFTNLFGGGTSNEYIIKDNGSKGTTFNSPFFVVVEPAIDIEVNLSEYLRVKAGVSYKHIFANNFESLLSYDLSGVGVQVGMKIGAF